MIKLDLENSISDGLSELQQKLQTASPEALKLVGEEIHNDVDQIEPKIPVDTGDLRNSKFIKEENGEVQIGYDMPYAARVHEMIDDDINWSRSGSGSQFLSHKLANKGLQEKYLEMLGKEIMK